MDKNSQIYILAVVEMHLSKFEQAVVNICNRDPRFNPHAYLFLRDAVSFTQKEIIESKGGGQRHITAEELLNGFRRLALQEFGPMTLSVLHEWGVKSTRDIGEMVFLLIAEKVFWRQEDDHIEDFDEVYDFTDSFETPFLPKKELLSR